jgi:hypothetical protein
MVVPELQRRWNDTCNNLGTVVAPNKRAAAVWRKVPIKSLISEALGYDRYLKSNKPSSTPIRCSARAACFTS